MLDLPYPDVDALGRPVWNVSPRDISRAYRKLSILVHPDKHPGEDARRAFEALSRAQRRLKDPGELEQILRDGLEAAVERRQKADAAGSLEDRMKRMAEKKKEEQQLRKEESKSLHAEILQQMKDRQAKARKRQQVRESRKEEAGLDMSPAGNDNQQATQESVTVLESNMTKDEKEELSDSDDETRRKRRRAMARRKGNLK